MKCNKQTQSQSLPAEIRIGLSVYERVAATIGLHAAETGGVFGGDPATGTITSYFFDEHAARSAVTYSPDIDKVNRLLSEQWNPRGIRLFGFPHSHPLWCSKPSGGDARYAEAILDHNPDLPFLAVPIVQTVPDTGRFKMQMFLARRSKDVGVEFVRVRMVLFEDGEDVDDQAADKTNPIQNAASDAPATETAVEEQSAMAKCEQSTFKHLAAAHQPLIQHTCGLCGPAPAAPSSTPDLTETFRRVRTSYNLARMARARLVCVGTGGAAGFIEAITRAGVPEHILIDPDKVSDSNLSTQQVYRRDIGRPKVDCLAERMRDINPLASILTRQQFLDEIDDATFERLALESFPGRPTPEVVLLCGFTDTFHPQARVNRLGLKLGLPTLCAQVYREGRAAEITYTFPGVTPACHRCILSPRYNAYLEEGYQNEVSSDGTPIFATDRLNATKGFIALAILHHGTDHPRWGSLLRRIGPRNLIQIRLDPDVESSLGLRNFSEALQGADPTQTLFDETIWRPQRQESPATGYAVACPDCGGTGDLRDAIGRITDTRIIPTAK